MGQSSICDTTIVCCNADHSIQACIGNIIINNPTVTETYTPPPETQTYTQPPATTTNKVPPVASVVPQANQCGNNVTTYCCNNDAVKGGDVSCDAMGQSSICDTTIVCCNADHSIQACIGNIIINNPTVTETYAPPPVTTPTKGPTKPGPPATTAPPVASVVPQANQCGNNVNTFCCNNEAVEGGDVSCSAMGQSSICDTTIVCCNAEHSIQACVGNIIINKPPKGKQTVTETVTETETGECKAVTKAATVTVPEMVVTTVTEEVTQTVCDCPPETTATHPHGHPTKPSHPTTTTAAPSSCPTTLSGNYEYPHLIVPIDSSKPNKALGSSYFGTISKTVSSIFDFDIPQSDSGKTCSLVFLFPKQSDLETSSYKFSGDGKIDVAELVSPATDHTTYNNAPKVANDLGTLEIAPGNSYVVSTFDCPAGERVGYEISNAGSTYLHYFQDYNPAP